MYEFAGPNPAGLRGEEAEDARCRSVSSSSLSVCFTGIFRGHVQCTGGTRIRNGLFWGGWITPVLGVC